MLVGLVGRFLSMAWILRQFDLPTKPILFASELGISQLRPANIVDTCGPFLRKCDSSVDTAAKGMLNFHIFITYAFLFQHTVYQQFIGGYVVEFSYIMVPQFRETNPGTRTLFRRLLGLIWASLKAGTLLFTVEAHLSLIAQLARLPRRFHGFAEQIVACGTSISGIAGVLPIGSHMQSHR